MLRSIPWDVWTALAIALALCLSIFEPLPLVLGALYFAVCAYILFETFFKELRG